MNLLKATGTHGCQRTVYAKFDFEFDLGTGQGITHFASASGPARASALPPSPTKSQWSEREAQPESASISVSDCQLTMVGSCYGTDGLGWMIEGASAPKEGGMTRAAEGRRGLYRLGSWACCAEKTGRAWGSRRPSLRTSPGVLLSRPCEDPPRPPPVTCHTCHPPLSPSPFLSGSAPLSICLPSYSPF